MSLTAHAAETVALHNALEAFTLGDPRHIDPILFREHIDGQRIAQVHFRHILKLSHLAFRGSAGFLEVS